MNIRREYSVTDLFCWVSDFYDYPEIRKCLYHARFVTHCNQTQRYTTHQLLKTPISN